ncbi:MAG: hypothetical protein PHE49_09510 [bacterium]|nr:hypothetical protein [bacterium]
MENESKYTGVLLLIAIIGLLIFWSEYSNLKNSLIETQDDLYYTEDRLYSCRDAIDEANSQLDEAYNYAWSSYDEMGEILENLYTVDY